MSVVRMLIDAKAKIDAVDNFKCEFFAFNNMESNEIFEFLCVNRNTAVHYAACFGHAKVVHWLAKVRYYVSAVTIFCIVRDIVI